MTSFLAIFAGVLPSIYEKLDLQQHVDEIISQSGQYKNLENSFKQAANITALDSNPDALKTEFFSLMRRIEELRSRPLVIPEKHFQKGRREVKDGRYEPDVIFHPNTTPQTQA